MALFPKKKQPLNTVSVSQAVKDTDDYMRYMCEQLEHANTQQAKQIEELSRRLKALE